MKRKIRSSLACAMFAVLLLLGVTNNSEVSAQGWHSAKPATSTRPSTEAKPSSSTNKATSSKSYSAKRETSKTRQSKAKPSTAATAVTKGTAATASQQTQAPETATTTTTTKGSRARRVAQAKPATSSSVAPTGSDGYAAKTIVGRCDPDKDERVDLSGTYKGQINYPAAGMSGEATLTVNGNRFTLESGSKTERGNVTAIVTCNYTAVAMMFGQWKTPVPGEKVLPPLPMLSLTAVKNADRLSLKPSPSERREFSFEMSAKK